MHERQIIEAYRWQRCLGNRTIFLPEARIVSNPDRPDVWDANHIDSVTASEPEAITQLLADADRHLVHCRWRVVHTDCFTPDAFTARLALDGYEEQRPVIQMALEGRVRAPAVTDLVPVNDEGNWQALAALIRADHIEGARTEGKTFSQEFTDSVVANNRAKSAAYHFHLTYRGDEPVGYGALAVAPNGVGMIEDLFTLPVYRRQGLASGMIAAFAEQLAARGCRCIFLGAQMGEQARHLYAKLGFQPLLLTRSWVREAVS
jgi:GNAT superfamily N-acetyltransferase